jgi:hypothetical protein
MEFAKITYYLGFLWTAAFWADKLLQKLRLHYKQTTFDIVDGILLFAEEPFFGIEQDFEEVGCFLTPRIC